MLKGRCRVIAIKENVDLCPWADVVYGCDGPWWRHRRGLPEFAGLKICYRQNNMADYPDIHRIDIDVKSDRLLDGVGKTGSGGNSGFQALNLAVQWGAVRILLIGFDMNGSHWYGRNRWPMANNPDESNYRRWKDAFGVAAAQCRQLGIEVINCSMGSAMDCFPKLPLEDALQ